MPEMFIVRGTGGGRNEGGDSGTSNEARRGWVWRHRGAGMRSDRGKRGWLCHHLPPALQLCPLRQDRWLVAALLLLTSALSLSPPAFPFLYLLAALFIPHRPHTAQLAGEAVRSRSLTTLHPRYPLLHIHITWYRKGARQVTGIGNRRTAALELSEGGDRLSFWFLEDRWEGQR